MNLRKTKSTDFRRYEWLVYAILWGWVWASPVLNTFLVSVRNDTSFSWDGILQTWNGILPFFIIFLLHCLLIRWLLLHHHIRTYMAAVLCTLCLFGTYRYLRMDKHPGIGHIAKPERQLPPETGLHDKGFPDGKPPEKPPLGQQDTRVPEPPRPKGKQPGALPVPLMLDLGITLLMFGFNIAIVLFFRYRQGLEKTRQLETANMQHELEYLKTQIHPHFFMNMLNSIHGMVEINPVMAQEMIIELSHLMRYMLYEGKRTYTTLRSETEFISAYVALMRKRYSSKKVAISLEMLESLPKEDIKIPPLLFIVIVENAFKHGISYQLPSFLNMSMAVGDGQIHFDCVNSRFDKKESDDEHHGIGLANLHKRLQLLYGDEFSLKINEQAHTYSVNLTIPYKCTRHETDTMHSDR